MAWITMILNKILLNLFANPLLSLAITNTERKVNLEDACGVRLSRSCPQIQKFIVGKLRISKRSSPIDHFFRRSLELCRKGSLECSHREERLEEATAERGAHLRPVRRQLGHPEPRADCGPLCLGKQGQSQDLPGALAVHDPGGLREVTMSSRVSPHLA